MKAFDWSKITPFKSTEADIINHKKAGVVYVADFPGGTGKYISVAEYGTKIDTPDIDIKVSPKINLRLTYIQKSEGGEIGGIEIAKVIGNKIDKVTLHGFDFKRVLELLHLFSEMDLNAISNRSIVLDESIIGNSEETLRFLKLIATDPQGKQKISEVAKNLGLIEIGDIDYVVQRRKAVKHFEEILNENKSFIEYKEKLGVGKDEAVWQKFFEANPWILGSDFVEILKERVIDEDSITDIPVKDYDGFVNIIELKLPTEEFWTKENIPVASLTKAIMQCARYLTEMERRMNDNKKIDRLEAAILKPRITLIYGRSCDWTKDQKEQFKILNSSFHDIAILTYDNVLERARKIIGP
jgi:hypothetical protein